MAVIVTRAGKGAPLSNAECDANFTNLNTDKLEINAALGTPASVTLTNATGLPTAGLVDNAVTNEKLRDSAGLSVIGRGANSTGDPADIVAGTNKQVLRRDGSSLGFGAVDLSSNQAVTGTLPVNQGGTGITSFGSGVATWLGTPSSANLAAAVTDETGTGALVFANSPTLVTPALGTPASGVVTNLTGTASININGTVGATTPATGAFTTLAASTSLSTPLVTNAGTLAFSATGANIVTASTNGVERLRITSAGNVGIGTTSPAYLLHTQAAQATNNALAYIKNTSASRPAYLGFTSSTKNFTVGVKDDVGYVIGTGDGIIAADADIALTINTSRNVGIGTTSPDAKLTVNGVASFAAGTAAAPSIARASDLNTGIFFPAADTIAASTAGSERLRITSAGQVAINTTTLSSGAQFQVKAGTDQHIVVRSLGSETTLETVNDAYNSNVPLRIYASEHKLYTGGTERLRLDTSGNVGIGTAAPIGRLDVAAATAPILQIRNTSNLASPAWQNATIGDLNFYADDPSGGGAGSVGRIRCVGNVNSDGAPWGEIAIWTGLTSGFAERLRINYFGNVGIGTASPAQKLDVVGKVRITDDLILAQVSGRIDYDNGSTGALRFFSTSTATERLRITSAGNVLIGKTTATANGGDLQVSSGITFPATQVAKSDANTLDDYEEGTFTPVLTGSTSGTFNGSGKYTKIGDVVNVFMQFVEITTGNKPIGDYTVTGLPFTSRATMPDATPLTIGGFARVTFDASKIQASAINANSTTVIVTELTSNGLTTALTDANFVNGSNMFFRISGSYPTST
jgi:hypothetical protein